MWSLDLLHRNDIREALVKATTFDEMTGPYQSLAGKLNHTFLTNLVCVQGSLKRHKSRVLPRLTPAKLCFYLYSLDSAFRYDLGCDRVAKRWGLEERQFHESFAAVPKLRKLDNAGIQEKQDSFKMASVLATPSDPFTIQYEQIGKDLQRAGIRYNTITASAEGNRLACYQCRLKGKLTQCANCPAAFHRVNHLPFIALS